MKRIVLNIYFLFITLAAVAQSKATSFDVAGIKVIMKPTQKEIINVSMYYRGGVANYPADKAGIENLALAATTECGTKKYDKDTFKDREDAFGVEVSGSSGYDNGTVSMNCISRFFDEGWGLFADAVTNPVFEEKELEMLKEKLISGIKQSESDPDERIEQLTIKNTFGGTPYAIDPIGEETTLAKLSAAEVKDYYYNQLLNKNRMFIVVVGKISKEEVIKRITASFASLPAKAYNPVKYTFPNTANGKLLTEERALATNYITGSFNAPAVASNDYLPYRLAVSALSNRLFREIRTKRNLSYAPYAHSVNRLMPYSVMYVSTTDPKASVEVMVEELRDLRDNGFSEEELSSGKSGFITNNYMKEESTGAIAAALGNAEVLGDWRIADETAERITKVTLAEMNSVLKKYVSTIRWSYLGDKKLAEDASAVFINSL
ncbi:M16 family metallopeptidase [Paradesertivirga mongoliensis]|uniref:M16 family metallopeptidase n=1 Tax=Paradesertivirga mongoliensis TaxID=2100740 RepID=A0ABW4ZS60_9SPHI|nr:pitrilysin family protein [Pedobacter mongoliensis]